MKIQALKLALLVAGLTLVSRFAFAEATATNLANLSARTAVGTGDNVGITGFIVRGDSGDTKRIVIRGL
ncbi:MAG TPA: hypothetical protein VJR93_03705, partial [Chthoniobacterales bacterium]|nr:hypothetical protein [Chthoniobacterales bacterium]